MFPVGGYAGIQLGNRTSGCASLKLRPRLKPLPFGLKRKEFYTTTHVANVLGISPDLLRWRIRAGQYPSPKWKNKRERVFTLDEVCTVVAMHQEPAPRSAVGLQFLHLINVFKLIHCSGLESVVAYATSVNLRGESHGAGDRYCSNSGGCVV